MPKVDKVEYEKRVRIVMEWIIQDWPSCDIIAQMENKWGLQIRQAKRYIAEARTRWGQQEDEELAQKLTRKILSLKKLKNSIKEEYKGTPKGIRAILAVEKEIITLEKMNPGVKLEITTPDGEPLQQIVYVRESNVDYSQLPDNVLEMILKARKKSDD